MTFSKTTIYIECHYAVTQFLYYYAECNMLIVIMLNGYAEFNFVECGGAILTA
jgi:hypothetical protein